MSKACESTWPLTLPTTYHPVLAKLQESSAVQSQVSILYSHEQVGLRVDFYRLLAINILLKQGAFPYIHVDRCSAVSGLRVRVFFSGVCVLC